MRKNDPASLPAFRYFSLLSGLDLTLGQPNHPSLARASEEGKHPFISATSFCLGDYPTGYYTRWSCLQGWAGTEAADLTLVRDDSCFPKERACCLTCTVSVELMALGVIAQLGYSFSPGAVMARIGLREHDSLHSISS